MGSETVNNVQGADHCGVTGRFWGSYWPFPGAPIPAALFTWSGMVPVLLGAGRYSTVLLGHLMAELDGDEYQGTISGM